MNEATFSHAISLLVHEERDVVVDQCLNFQTFAPQSAVIIHVSANGSVDKSELRLALAEAGCDRCFVNQVSHTSRWGNIINGHFENIRALEDLLSDFGYVSLHASNDMLLRVLPNFAELKEARYEVREVSPGSLWYTGRQFAASPAFARLLNALECRYGAGCQVEGSTYPYTLLRELADVMRPLDYLLADLPLVAEEIIFSTWALSHLGEPQKPPYVLLRPSILPQASLAMFPRSLRSTSLGSFVHRGLNRLEAMVSAPEARIEDADAIAAGVPLKVKAWGLTGKRRPATLFYGIKRVERTIGSPLRKHITSYTARQSGVATA